MLPAGSTFADYTIDGVLARGGMGVVYRATQERPRRRVALKLIAPERAADPQYRDRFLREMDTLASLEHPNIVPIHAAGEWEGQLYLAMRLVDGPDLGTLIAREGPMSVARALSILDPVANALEAAHAEGLVHRDVKPGNILVDSRGSVYLTDFGLTKRSISETGPTMPGQAIGSPGYMSPEQFTTGISTDPVVAAKTDQYALACVLYACLTGREPYHRDTWEAAMWAHVYAPVPRLSERRPDLPVAIDRVLEVALAKDPAARFASTTAFLAAVRDAVPAASQVVVPTRPQDAAPSGGVDTTAQAAAPPPGSASTPVEPDPSAVPPPPRERRRVDEILGAGASPAVATPESPTQRTVVVAHDAAMAEPSTSSGAETVVMSATLPPGLPPAGRPVDVDGPSEGTNPRRGRIDAARLLPAGIVGAAGVGLIAVMLGTGVLGGAGASRSPAPSAIANTDPTPTPSTRAQPSPSVQTSFGPLPSAVIATYGPGASAEPSPSGGAAYAELLDHIPAGIRDSCFPVSLSVPIAAAGCTDAKGRPVYYEKYSDKATMDGDYESWRNYYGAPKDKGSCETSSSAESEWYYTTDSTTPRGRLMCTPVKNGERKYVLAWTIASDLTYVELWSDDWSSLFPAWTDNEVSPS